MVRLLEGMTIAGLKTQSSITIRTMSLATRHTHQQTTMGVETKIFPDCAQHVGCDKFIIGLNPINEVANTHAAPFTIRLGRDNLATIGELGNVKNVRHGDD